MRHVDEQTFLHLPINLRPKINAAELARIAGPLTLPATAEGASDALRFVWQCAAVIAETNADMEWRKKNDTTRLGSRRRTAAVLGFDPQAQDYPLTDRKFLALLMKRNRGGLKFEGKRLTGAALVRRFRFDFHSPELENGPDGSIIQVKKTRTKKFIDRKIKERQERGWENATQVENFALAFTYWRERLSRNHKERRKKNLKRGDAKKSITVQEFAFSVPPVMN